MPQTKKPEADTHSQRQKFIDAAREVGTSGDERAFRKAVGWVREARAVGIEALMASWPRTASR